MPSAAFASSSPLLPAPGGTSNTTQDLRFHALLSLGLVISVLGLISFSNPQWMGASLSEAVMILALSILIIVPLTFIPSTVVEHPSYSSHAVAADDTTKRPLL